ncbi:MAG TPA: hypothetical protein VF155_04240 [Candidatus Dormibacteraeota bacterium]
MVGGPPSPHPRVSSDMPAHPAAPSSTAAIRPPDPPPPPPAPAPAYNAYSAQPGTADPVSGIRRPLLISGFLRNKTAIIGTGVRLVPLIVAIVRIVSLQPSLS